MSDGSGFVPANNLNGELMGLPDNDFDAPRLVLAEDAEVATGKICDFDRLKPQQQFFFRSPGQDDFMVAHQRSRYLKLPPGVIWHGNRVNAVKLDGIEATLSWFNESNQVEPIE